MRDHQKWQVDPRILESRQEATPPPSVSDVTPQWWVDPLAHRLAEAEETWRWHGEHVGALLIRMLAGGGAELRTSLAQLFATNHEGDFFHPANEHANPRWSAPYRITGPPVGTLEKSDVTRIGVLAELAPTQLQQVNGVALVLVRAANGFQVPPRFEIGEPSGPGLPGDVVKVRRVATKRARVRSIGFKRMLRYKGAIADTIREFELIFGQPHYLTAAKLIKLLSGVQLTPDEVKVLVRR
jgi:hypothetical protein